MKQETVTIFDILKNFKYLTKAKYIVNKDDRLICYNFWRLYKINKHMKFIKFRDAVINFSILKGVSFLDALFEICEKIKIEN